MMLRKRSVPIANPNPSIVPPDPSAPRLTTAQIEIIKWIMDGKRTNEISELMGISVASVHQQVYRIMEMTGANTRAALVVYALRRAILNLPPMKAS